MWIVRASLKNPFAVAVLAAMILVVGTVALVRIPKDILPTFKAPAVQVMTYYQGMPTASVEGCLAGWVGAGGDLVDRVLFHVVGLDLDVHGAVGDRLAEE